MDISGKRIGFACIIVDKNENVLSDTKMKTIKVKHFSNLSETGKALKLAELCASNLKALTAQVEWLSDQFLPLRFMRITSDLFPLVTHPICETYYKELWPKFETTLNFIGDIVRKNHCRITSHPGQFCILNSPNKDLTFNSIKELEYHARIFEMMGLNFRNGTVINIHGGKQSNGLDQFITNSKLLSNNARNLISIENDEFSFGIDAILKSDIPNNFPVVFDLHHHWINTGEYIKVDDPRWKMVIKSWRGVRPKIHISMSPEELVANLPIGSDDLHIAPNEKKSKLRKHSDMIWHPSYRTYALEFLQHGDLMIEAKNKNLAAKQLYEEII